MRTLFICVLAANLVGCAARIDSKPVALKDHPQNARSTKLTNPPTRSSAEFGKKTKAVAKRPNHTVTGKTTASLPPTQPNDNADPVTEEAKARIAAMMENPASAEFTKLKRAVKKLLSKSVDTICGYVRGKTASGEDTGEMPFLYIIDDGRDGAYLVDGKSHVSDAVHGVICK
jgi:hypothetical protein